MCLVGIATSHFTTQPWLLLAGALFALFQTLWTLLLFQSIRMIGQVSTFLGFFASFMCLSVHLDAKAPWRHAAD